MGIVAHSTFTQKGIEARRFDPEALEREHQRQIAEMREAAEQRRRQQQAEIRRLQFKQKQVEARAAKWRDQAKRAEAYIAEQGIKPAARAKTMHKIAERFSKATGVSLKDIKGTSRQPHIVIVRHAVFYWARRLTTSSLPQMGRFAGGKDHTTIRSAIIAYPKKRAAMGRYVRPLYTGTKG